MRLLICHESGPAEPWRTDVIDLQSISPVPSLFLSCGQRDPSWTDVNRRQIKLYDRLILVTVSADFLM